jgi:hypothetical protein
MIIDAAGTFGILYATATASRRWPKQHSTRCTDRVMFARLSLCASCGLKVINVYKSLGFSRENIPCAPFHKVFISEHNTIGEK